MRLSDARAERARREASGRASEPEPLPSVAEHILRLQRGAGNQAVARLIATENAPKTLFAPTSMDLEGEGGRVKTSLESLLPGHSVRRPTLKEFHELAFTGYGREDPVAWGKANLGHGLDPSERTPFSGFVGVNAATVAAIDSQFADPMQVFKYSRLDMVQYGVEDLGTSLLLEPEHMGERPGELPQRADGASACVVQALESIGQEVPGKAQHTTDAWHQYCRAEHIDYRTDNQIAKLYVEKLHFALVSNTVMPWTAIDWAALGGDRTYLVATYPHSAPAGSQIGHMIGVEVANGAPATIHDQQGITKPELRRANHRVHVRYVYRV